MGAAIGSVTSIVMRRMDRNREMEAFRREALDRFRRDRLKTYSTLEMTSMGSAETKLVKPGKV